MEGSRANLGGAMVAGSGLILPCADNSIARWVFCDAATRSRSSVAFPAVSSLS
jgi:hypothetical protein